MAYVEKLISITMTLCLDFVMVRLVQSMSCTMGSPRMQTIAACLRESSVLVCVGHLVCRFDHVEFFWVCVAAVRRRLVLQDVQCPFPNSQLQNFIGMSGGLHSGRSRLFLVCVRLSSVVATDVSCYMWAVERNGYEVERWRLAFYHRCGASVNFKHTCAAGAPRFAC